MTTSSPAHRLTVVLVAYNSREVIGGALDSIDHGIRTIVVDNASADDTCELIQQRYPHVELVRLPENIGFGRANNVALRMTATEFALLLNPDARLLSADTLPKLLAAADRYPHTAILSPTIVDEDGEVALTLLPPIFKRRKAIKTFSMGDVAGDACTEWLTGSAMLLRMACFSTLPHFFDPNIFMYHEDDDICLTARQHGYSTIHLHDIRVQHLDGRSSPPTINILCLKNRHRTFSRLYVVGKHNSRAQAIWLATKILLRNSISTIGYAVIGNRTKQWTSFSRVQGALSFLNGRQLSELRSVADKNTNRPQ